MRRKQEQIEPLQSRVDKSQQDRAHELARQAFLDEKLQGLSAKTKDLVVDYAVELTGADQLSAQILAQQQLNDALLDQLR